MLEEFPAFALMTLAGPSASALLNAQRLMTLKEMTTYMSTHDLLYVNVGMFAPRCSSGTLKRSSTYLRMTPGLMGAELK